MSMWTDWYIADPSEARAIAATVTDEADDGGWPHVELSSVLQSELMALHGVLVGKPGEWVDVTGNLLYHEGEPESEEGSVGVSEVSPAFVSRLAGVDDNKVAKIAAAWQKSAEGMADWEPDTVAAVLREAVAFARQAVAAGTPVLELVVI